MPDQDDAFRDLIRRVRAGDDGAAAELLRGYAPEVCRAVRVHLMGSRLRRLFDSADICQSVFAVLFARLAAGQLVVEQPCQLGGLLRAMARNKLRDKGRKEQARRHGGGLRGHPDADLETVADARPDPADALAEQEWLDKLRGWLSRDELQLIEQRGEGRAWADIAADLGVSPEALRKQYARALRRVARRHRPSSPTGGGL